MDRLISNYSGVPHRAISREQVKRHFEENSGEIAVGSGVGTATFATLRNSAKVGDRAVKLVNETKYIQAANKAKILKVFSKFKFLNNPVVRKLAGPLAGFAGLSTLFASTAKIADTCSYLQGKKD